MDSLSPTIGFHLEHPPQRTVSLLRAKEIHSLANKRMSTTSCSITNSFMEALEFPTTPSPSPAEWGKEFPKEVIVLDDTPTFEDPIVLPSTPPSAPLELDHFSRISNNMIKLEADEELDFHIPLMTSLFYQEEDEWACPPQHKSKRHLHRDMSINSKHSFPRDALSWYISPAITPRTASPCIPPPCASTSHDSRSISSRGRRTSYISFQPNGPVHTISNFYDCTQLPVRRNQSRSQSRRTRRTKIDPTRLLAPSTDSLNMDCQAGKASVWITPVKPLHPMAGAKHIRSRALPLPPLIPPRSPIRRPLPPKPTTTPATQRPIAKQHNSFLCLRDSKSSDINVTGLIGLVDNMVLDTEDRTAIAAH